MSGPSARRHVSSVASTLARCRPSSRLAIAGSKAQRLGARAVRLLAAFAVHGTGTAGSRADVASLPCVSGQRRQKVSSSLLSKTRPETSTSSSGPNCWSSSARKSLAHRYSGCLVYGNAKVKYGTLSRNTLSICRASSASCHQRAVISIDGAILSPRLTSDTRRRFNRFASTLGHPPVQRIRLNSDLSWSCARSRVCLASTPLRTSLNTLFMTSSKDTYQSPSTFPYQ
jgi:hypothetical protein